MGQTSQGLLGEGLCQHGQLLPPRPWFDPPSRYARQITFKNKVSK